MPNTLFPTRPEEQAPAFSQQVTREGVPQVLFRPQEQADVASFGRSLSTAFSLDSPIASVSRLLEAGGLDVDEDWLLSPETQNEYTADVEEALKPDLLDVLAGSVSRQHADILKEQFILETERERILTQAGGKGLAARLIANIADPVNLALAFSTGGVGLVTKAGALQGALRVGAWTAAESAAIETAIVAGSHTRGVDDIALSALGGFVLGSGAGALLGKLGPKTAQATADAMNRQADSLKNQALEAAGLDSAGAARVRGYNEPLMEDDVARMFDIDTSHDVPFSAMGKVRFDAVGVLGQDADPAIRDLSRKLAEEAVGLEGHGPSNHGASEVATLIHRRLMSRFRRSSLPEYGNWLKETGQGWTKRLSLARRDDFYSEVGRAVRAGDHESPAIRRAAEAASRSFASYLDELKKAKVAGFENIPSNPRYLPRVANHANIRELRARYGSTQIEELVAAGMRAMDSGLDSKVIKTIAKGYVNKLSRLSFGMDAGLAHGLRLDDVDFLRQMLREADMDDDLIETTIASTKKAVAEGSKTSRAKRRLDLDENVTMRLKHRETGEETVVPLTDLFESNVEKMLFAYSRQMSGWIGLSRQANIRSPGDVQKVLNMVRSRGEKFGKSIDEIENNVKRVEFLVKGITGVPLESDPASLFASTARAVRDFNFLRVGAAFGLAQLAEIGSLLGTVGFRNVLSGVPALRGMIRRGVDGILEDDLAAEIEDMLAPGVDRLLNQASTRWEEHGFGVAERGIMGAIDDGVQVAKRATADVGGLNAATIVFQRMAARGIAQKLTGFATGAKLSGAQMRRMKGMGIDVDGGMWTRIRGQIQKYSDTTKSFVPGRKLQHINPDKWDDQEALDIFTLAVHREARRVVQENDIGASTPWLHSTLGKAMTQFRTFSLTSWSKATLHNIHHHDFQAFSSLTFSMFMGGLAYVAQQSINTADPKKRAERLQPDEIAKAAFQRTAIASILPSILDTAATTVFRADPLFAYGRSSGLATGFIQGIPTVDAYDKLAQAAGLPAVAARPDMDMTKRDYRSLTALIPVIGGLTGMRRVLDSLADELPD